MPRSGPRQIYKYTKEVREARRAFTKYRVRCFWSYDAALRITAADVPRVAEQWMRNGDRDAFRLGATLAARGL